MKITILTCPFSFFIVILTPKPQIRKLASKPKNVEKHQYIMACRFYDQISCCASSQWASPFLELGNFTYVPGMLLHRPYPAYRPHSSYSPAVLHKH
jgi:hypothetical protein